MPKAVADQLDFGRVERWGSPAERSSQAVGEIGPRPDSFAKRASWTRPESPSFRKMVVRCAFTVCSVIMSRLAIFLLRSEERRVGKECRSGWWTYVEKKKVES